MRRYSFSLFFSLVCIAHQTCAEEINFLACDAASGRIVAATGEHLRDRYSPCSTFKIALSLIGYDQKILQDSNNPIWPYDGSNVAFDAWKKPQTPSSWMELSVVWYSKILAKKIGVQKLHEYVTRFSYGNCDLSGSDGTEDAFVTAHLGSSLKISPFEQVLFLQNCINNRLPVGSFAIDMTKKIIPCSSYASGCKLYAKTGAGITSEGGIFWYIGWIEKNAIETYVFALCIKNPDHILSKKERVALLTRLFHDARIDFDLQDNSLGTVQK